MKKKCLWNECFNKSNTTASEQHLGSGQKLIKLWNEQPHPWIIIPFILSTLSTTVCLEKYLTQGTSSVQLFDIDKTMWTQSLCRSLKESNSKHSKFYPWMWMQKKQKQHKGQPMKNFSSREYPLWFVTRFTKQFSNHSSPPEEQNQTKWCFTLSSVLRSIQNFDCYIEGNCKHDFKSEWLHLPSIKHIQSLWVDNIWIPCYFLPSKTTQQVNYQNTVPQLLP